MEDFIANAALLSGQLVHQCEKAAASQASAAADLRGTAAEVRKEVLAGKAEITHNAKSAVREVLSQEIPAAVEAIAQAGDRLTRITEQLARDQAVAGAHMRKLGWKALGALLLASALLIGVTGYIASNNLARAASASVDAEILEALRSVSITSCDGQPCVKLSDGQARWTKNDDYILVDTSAAQGAPAP
ncbi:hypothetical protein [Luteimonas fraxinea]|uniref:hypothetical protein n=1 Tax=Luteimonas fraxinea TaxID=2901869 RepID=UPI001E4F1259|nr:hypothetical protein [Luteimonas fraxinea]MCD9125352.1 hypothetical protein [Luteimonas fraxinea]